MFNFLKKRLWLPGMGIPMADLPAYTGSNPSYVGSNPAWTNSNISTNPCVVEGTTICGQTPKYISVTLSGIAGNPNAYPWSWYGCTHCDNYNNTFVLEQNGGCGWEGVTPGGCPDNYPSFGVYIRVIITHGTGGYSVTLTCCYGPPYAAGIALGSIAWNPDCIHWDHEPITFNVLTDGSQSCLTTNASGFISAL
jgi:hypothetical protein